MNPLEHPASTSLTPPIPLIWYPWTPLPHIHTNETQANRSVLPKTIAIHPDSLMSTPSPEDWFRVQGSRILVMGSGSGSNFEALTQTLRPWGIKIAGVFCDRQQAGILDRAKRLEVPSYTPPRTARDTPQQRDDAILEFLQQPFDLLVLAGYMKIVPAYIVERHVGRILNIHPSLLPHFPGLHAIQQAWNVRVSTTGVTVHEVDQGIDTGPILAQAQTPIYPEETITSLEARIHRIEHALYPWVVAHWLLAMKRKASS